jgi:hypothetical protein
MTISRIVLLACALHSLVVDKSSAQIIDYNITGTFASSVPSTLVSAPNATFDIQFSSPAQQPPNSFTNGFDVFFTDESYALNGQTIFSGQSSRALFGMGIHSPTDTLDVYLPSQYNDGFFFDGLQELFTGAVSNPTLIPASFDFIAGTIDIGSTPYSLPNSHVTATAAVPEPPPLALAGTATLLLGGGFIVHRTMFGSRRFRAFPAFSAFQTPCSTRVEPDAIFPL